MQERIPFALTIDVEPDTRIFDPASRPRWIGFERLLPEMQRFRRLLATATGVPVHFTWMIRLDQQIQRTYGRADWAFEQYRRELDELRAAGDEIGVHTHSWRWDEKLEEWIADHGDARWVGRCIDESLATYRRATGARARVFNHGDHFSSNECVRRLDRAGVICDMTVVPGFRGKSRMRHEERATGQIPDALGAPRIPYRPSPRDYLQPGVWRRRRLWITPVTSAILPNPLTGSDEPDCQSLLLGAPFDVTRRVLEDYLATSPLPLVVSAGRTDVLQDAFNAEQFRRILHHLADQAQRCRLVFETLPEALARHQRALSARGYGRSDLARIALATRFPSQPPAELASTPLPTPAATPISEQADPHLLRLELTAERRHNRALTGTVQKLKDRLEAIEMSRLWRWRRRWQQVREILAGVSNRVGGGVVQGLGTMLTRPGWRLARRIAKVVFRKLYLWLEEEPVKIVSADDAGAPATSIRPPQTPPVNPYERWLAEQTPHTAELDRLRAYVAEMKRRPKISVIVPVYNPKPEFLRGGAAVGPRSDLS